MDFVLVALAAQLADVGIALGAVGDGFAGEEGGAVVFPQLVFAFDFANGA